MNEIVKALGKFLGRDLMYVIGGASFVLAGLFAMGFKLNETAELVNNPVVSILALGFVYVVGYINQEVICLTPLLTTSIVHPCCLIRWFYKRFTRLKFEDVPEIDYTSERIKLSKSFGEEELSDLERIIALKHIGSAVGSNWLLTSIILLVWCIVKGEWGRVLIGGTYLLIAALSLILMAWIKGMQQYSVMRSLMQTDRSHSNS